MITTIMVIRYTLIMLLCWSVCFHGLSELAIVTGTFLFEENLYLPQNQIYGVVHDMVYDLVLVFIDVQLHLGFVAIVPNISKVKKHRF